MLLPPINLTASPAEVADNLRAVLAWSLPLAASVLGAAFFATLRAALHRSVPSRVLGESPTDGQRARLAPLLARADTLATTAGVFEIACRAAFSVLLYRVLVGDGPGTWIDLALTMAIAVPSLLLLCDAVPTVVALRQGDALLRALLPAFHAFQLPLRWLVHAFESLRGALLRAVGLDQNPATARQIVEGLRDVIEEAEMSGDLDETEREIIGNVIETRDASVSAVMTPRTQVFGVEVSEGLVGAAKVLAGCGHSRIPVYDGSLDSILGTVSARDVVQAASEQRLEEVSLQSVLRPAHFVPETKGVRELLAELRHEKIKIAIVLDEYGGTAGLVTLGDIVQEIVGEIADERDAGAALPIRRLLDGSADVDAALRVAEVNEELGTEIPEEQGYETLAGFVLAELGHVPKRGESFRAHGAEFKVLEASDRRVLRVGVRRAVERALA